MTTELFRTQFDAITGETKEIPPNAEELIELEKAAAKIEADKLAKEEKATAKAALLAKLGITADEAALLLS